MASTGTKRIWYSRYLCEKSGDFPEITLRGKRVEVCPVTIDAWTALDLALRYTYYNPLSIGTQNCRPITNGSGYSLHAYGIAVDFDPYALGNPYYPRGTWKGANFSWSNTKFTPTQIQAVERIRTRSGKRVWMWGGRWLFSKDYMHFEVDVSPRDLDENQGGGIDWYTVPGIGEILLSLTQDEIKFIKEMIASLDALDPPSNSHALVTLVKDYRERKQTG